jgi:hypothetical protein
MKNTESSTKLPQITIVTASGEIPVSYVSNMRFADFMKHNAFTDVEIANEYYNQVKVVFAQAVEKELAKIQAIDVKQSAVFKGGEFKIRSNIVKEQAADCTSIQHEALVRQWAHKKAIDSQKAQEKASVFLAAKNQPSIVKVAA